MKLRTIGLAIVAAGFMTTSALAQATMAPIPNPPEKPKMAAHHHKKAKKAKPAATTEAAAPAAADATKK